MPSSVELNGMTINLVENQEVYESMTKNPNELYFVGGEDGGKIDSIKVNGATQTIVDKTVDISVPTTLAGLTDDSTHRLVTDTEKNTWNGKGTYSKPSGGIPKTDLASSVQTSLGLADNAVPRTRTVNGKALSSNITLSASDVGADSSGTASSAINTHDASSSAHSSLFAEKQSKLTGTPGQVVGFDASGNAIAQAAPQTGYSKTETLTAATAALYGLTSTAVPDDVFERLSNGVIHQQEMVRDKDGGTYWERYGITSDYWKSICYGDGKYLLLSDRKTLMHSMDAQTWYSCSFNHSANSNWQQVCFGNGVFLAVNSGSLNLMRSTDGINFSNTPLPSNIGQRSICYGGGKFVVLGDSNVCFYSEDGLNWNQSTMPVSQTWWSLCYGDGKYLAGGAYGVSAYSTDAITWTPITIPSSQSANYSCYGGGYFVVGDSSAIAYSSDLISWTRKSIPIIAYNICYGYDKFVVVGYQGKAAYSRDLQNWISVPTTSSYNINALCYGNSEFVAISGSNSGDVEVSRDVFSYKDVLFDILLNRLDVGAKIETGSYVGTGTYGASNKNSITFSFTPKLWGIIEFYIPSNNQAYPKSNVFAWDQNLEIIHFRTSGSVFDDVTQYATINGNTISWYTTQTDASKQLNANGWIYHYFAIG